MIILKTLLKISPSGRVQDHLTGLEDLPPDIGNHCPLDVVKKLQERKRYYCHAAPRSLAPRQLRDRVNSVSSAIAPYYLHNATSVAFWR